MSPEQAKGRTADKRSDVWAFGCVLYEMLTGRRAFEGEDLSDTLASVIKSEPDWAALPASVPAHVRTILKGCLEKDRRVRIPDLAVVRYVLDGTVAAPAPPAGIPGRAHQGRRGLRVWQTATALFLLASVLGIPATYLLRSTTPAVARFFVLPPAKLQFMTGARAATSAAISPDGRTLAFTTRDAVGKIVLWVRPIDSFSPQLLPGTDGAQFPFWSPDSRFVGFFANGKLLKIDVTGGPPQTLCACGGRGAAWSREGVIVFNNGLGPLVRVSSTGGQPAPLTRLSQGQLGHDFPSFLPDGRHVLYYATAASQDLTGLYAAALDTGESTRLGGSSSGGVYDRRGYLLFVREGTLLAQSFNAKTLMLAGEPFPIAERVESTVFAGVLAFSASDTGVLAYGVGSGTGAALQMNWFDRLGKLIEAIGPEGNYRGLDLSLDVTRIAAHRHDGQGGDIWITELSRGATSRFTFDAAQDNSSPIWSPDGSRIVFGSVRNGKWGLYLKASDGTGTEDRLIESDAQVLPMTWAPDGRSIVYQVYDPKTQQDQWLLPLSGDRKAVPLLNTVFVEIHPQISPDGRWLAYSSDESGQAEIYVRPFPMGLSKWQVSTAGGQFPRWRADGHELFYMSQQANGKLMAVEVRSAGSTFEVGAPKALFDSLLVGNLAHPSGGNYHPYAVSRDGQRFLIPSFPASSSAADAASSPIAVVLNWAAGLR
jgi:Tol biopolymer transport system component